MSRKKIAVLMTCHNRKGKTLLCLEALFKQSLPEDFDIQVYLVDDGSTDGTGEAIKNLYPEVVILKGDGNLFWNGGMRLAFAEALKNNNDYYLWLNDDTILYPDALKVILNTYFQIVTKSIVVGSTCDLETGNVTYGGLVRCSLWHPLKFRLIKPAGNPLPCHTMNGNCVFIPVELVKILGNLDASFRHLAGDLDYGLRAQKNGIPIRITPGYVGTCATNPLSIFNLKLPLHKHLQIINQPKGLSIKEWKVISQRHAGSLWFIYWLMPYTKLFIRSIIYNSYKNIENLIRGKNDL